MEYKMGMRFILFFTVLYKRYLGNYLFYKLQGLKEGEIDKFLTNKKYNHQNTSLKLIN